MLTGHQGHVHPRLKRLFNQALLLFRGIPATALHGEDLRLSTRHNTISGHRSYPIGLDLRSVRSFRGLIQTRLSAKWHAWNRRTATSLGRSGYIFVPRATSPARR